MLLCYLTVGRRYIKIMGHIKNILLKFLVKETLDTSASRNVLWIWLCSCICLSVCSFVCVSVWPFVCWQCKMSKVAHQFFDVRELWIRKLTKPIFLKTIWWIRWGQKVRNWVSMALRKLCLFICTFFTSVWK